MIILGIETSTSVCSVGMTNPGSNAGQMNDFGSCAERSIVESHIHSEKILSLIEEICIEQKRKLSQINGIAVSIGPGSFTGLRIGLSTAKGLCCALEIPLIAVPTFKAIAASLFLLHTECERAIVCIDAKQGEFYIGVYDRGDKTPEGTVPVHIGDISSVSSFVNNRSIIVADCMDALKKEKNNSVIIKNVFPFCRGDVIARLAFEKMDTGIRSDWENLEPMYLKDFTVKTLTKK